MSRTDITWNTSEAIRLAARRGERHGIRRRFVIAISALVALVLTAQGAFLVLFGHAYLEREIEREARSFASLAAAPLCDGYARHGANSAELRAVAARLLKLSPDLDGLAVYGVDGTKRFRSDGGSELSAETRPADPGVRTDAGRLTEALQSREPVAWRGTGTDGHRHYVIVQPFVESQGRHRHSAVFWISYDSLQGAMLDTGWRVGLLAFFALALGVACAWVLSAQSLRPVETLIRGARRLAKGDLEHRIRLRSGDELETLGTTLDHMAELLSRTFSDLERSNVRLERLNRELKEIDRVKSDLLANVSHELRTPLTAIRGYVEAMSLGLLGDMTTVQTESLQVVERNIDRLRLMIDQLLSYSRMESGRIEVDLRPFDLEAVARDEVEAVRAAAGDRRRVELRTPGGLPEAHGDPGLIAQVLENLLTNAVKFSPPGAPAVLTLGAVEGGLRVEVADEGIGIPKEERGKIFDRFYQVDASSRRQYGGMGLGLAIVQEILELHQCSIELDTAPGEGSTFAFVLPLAMERTGYVRLQAPPRAAVVEPRVEDGVP
ncbi:MAG: HAMP domain-containing sensor histidine kinase [Acidobacteriota bacterium]